MAGTLPRSRTLYLVLAGLVFSAFVCGGVGVVRRGRSETTACLRRRVIQAIGSVERVTFTALSHVSEGRLSSASSFAL